MFYEELSSKFKTQSSQDKHESPDKKDQPLFEERDTKCPDFKFVPGNHLWKQQGYYLVCYSCDLSHAVWIGADKLMVGVNKKGKPILKLRSEIGMV